MSDTPDWFKLKHGKSIQDLARQLPNYESVAKKTVSRLKTNHDLRTFGYSETGEVFVSEEERYANFHILGAPGEGKSKFLEYHIRKDIDMSNGICLLDPSDNGDTAKNVLNYCASIGYEKVILIDPTLILQYKKIPCLAPLNPKSVKRSVEGIMEAFSILFEAKSTATPRIRRYLSALLRVLAARKMTLKDAQYFSNFYTGAKKLKELSFDTDVQTLKSVFRTEYNFENYFSSSINRLDSLWQEPLASILSNSEGMNFTRAVADGWVILVNLSPYQLTPDETQLLGIIVISQIIQAVDTLQNSHRGKWHGVYYLYIDEVGRFATPQIETLLSYKRKSGIRMYLAHHYYDQFEDKKKTLSAIENNTGIKLMFNTRSYDDRMRMIKSLGYGGNIPHTLAVYANSDLPKQHAVLKKNKEAPVRIRIPDVESVPDAPDEYIKKILSYEFYKDVQNEGVRTNMPPAPLREMDDREATDKSNLPAGILAREQQQSVSEGDEKPKNPQGRRKTLKI